MKKRPAPAKKTLPKLEPLVKKFGAWLMGSSLPSIFLVCTYIIGRYLFNADFSYPSEIVLNIVLFAFAIELAFRLYKRLLRKFGMLATHIATMLTSYQIYTFSTAFPRLAGTLRNFTPLHTPFSEAVVILLLSGLLFAGLAVGFVWLVRRFVADAELPLLKILVFTVSFLFVSQLGKMSIQIWKFRHELAYKQPALNLKQDPKKIASKPNIYYLVFDRYASRETLEKVYKYDNSPTLDFLSSQGFYNRENALSNYPFTMQSIGSTLRMDYHKDLHQKFKDSAQPFQAGFPYRSYLDNPPAIKELQKNGYTFNMVSSWWDFTRKNPIANAEPSQSYRLRILGKTFWASDLQRDIINKSALSPLLLKGFSIGDNAVIKYDLDRNFEQIFKNQVETIQTIVTNTKNQKQPQVTFAHILLPHDPYLFMPDGSTVKYDGNRTDDGADEYTKYRNQLIYANTQLEKIIAQIRSDDPNAVVLLQTDEGPYPKEFRGTQTAKKYYTPLGLSGEGTKRKFGSFASYYLPGLSADETAAAMDSHVNAFRFVLSHYLGYDLPNLPDCHYAVGAKFNLFDYTDVTKQIDPASTADCKQFL